MHEKSNHQMDFAKNRLIFHVKRRRMVKNVSTKKIEPHHEVDFRLHREKGAVAPADLTGPLCNSPVVVPKYNR